MCRGEEGDGSGLEKTDVRSFRPAVSRAQLRCVSGACVLVRTYGNIDPESGSRGRRGRGSMSSPSAHYSCVAHVCMSDPCLSKEGLNSALDWERSGNPEMLDIMVMSDTKTACVRCHLS